MQIDKLLLRSIALGIGMAAATSCSVEEKMALDPDDCVDGCTEHCVGECVNGTSTEGAVPDFYMAGNCPACGMG